MFGSPLPAVEFLTTLRWHAVPDRAADAVARSLWAFPLVGLGVGLALFGVERGARELFPAPAEAFLVVLAWVALTGGLHLDGLADAADGLFGGRDRADRLRIMHDVRTGTWGTLALVILLLGKFAALAALPMEGRFAALVLAPVAARGGIVAAMAALPYARPEGFGRSLHAAARGAPAVIGLLTPLLAGGVLLGPEGVGVAAAVLGAGAITLAYVRARIGGLTGDLDGALMECTELAALLIAAAAVAQGWAAPLLWDGG